MSNTNENQTHNPRSIAIAEDTVHPGQPSPTAIWLLNQMPGAQDGAGDGMSQPSLEQPHARLPMPVPPYVLSTLFARLEQAAISGEEPHTTLMQGAGVSEMLERHQIAGEVTPDFLSQTPQLQMERGLQVQQDREDEQQQQMQQQAQMEQTLEEQRQQEEQTIRNDVTPEMPVSAVEQPLPQRQQQQLEQQLLVQQQEQMQQLGEQQEWLQRQAHDRQAHDRQAEEQDEDQDRSEQQPQEQRRIGQQQEQHQRDLLQQELESQAQHIREREQWEQQLWEHQQRLQRQREQQLQEQLQQELQVRAQQLREEQLSLQRQREQAEQRVNAASQRERREDSQQQRDRQQRGQQQRDRQRREQLQRERLELQRLVTLLAGRTRSPHPSVVRNLFPAPSARMVEQMRAARFLELSNNAAITQPTSNTTAVNDNQSSRTSILANSRAASILQSARATLNALQDIATAVTTLTGTGMDCATSQQGVNQPSGINRNVPLNGNGATFDMPFFASPQNTVNPPTRTGYRMPYSIAANVLPLSLSNISIAPNMATAPPPPNNANVQNFYNITNGIGENHLNTYSVGNNTSTGSNLPYLSNLTNSNSSATGNNFSSFSNPPPAGYNIQTCGHSNLQASLYFPNASPNFPNTANRTVFPVLLNRPANTSPGYNSSTGSQLPIVANVRTLSNLAANPVNAAVPNTANYQNNTNYLLRPNIPPAASFYSGVNFSHVRNPAPNVNFIPTNPNFPNDFGCSNNCHTDSNYAQRLPNPLANTSFTYINPTHLAWFSANAFNNVHNSAYMEPILKAICTWQYHARIAQQNLMAGNQALEDLYQQPQYAHIYQSYHGVPFSPSTTSSGSSNNNNNNSDANVNSSNRNTSSPSTNTSSTTITATTVRNQSSFNASALREDELSVSDAHSGLSSNIGSLYVHSQSPNTIDSEEDDDVVEYLYDHMEEPSPA